MDFDYRDNFIKGVKIMMAEHDIKTVKLAAKELGVPEISLYKIMDKSNSPTVDQCILLAEKNDFNLNWILRNVGHQRLADQTDLSEIKDMIKKITDKL